MLEKENLEQVIVKCVRCGKEMKPQKSRYIEGGGQLCANCYLDVYGKAYEHKRNGL